MHQVNIPVAYHGERGSPQMHQVNILVVHHGEGGSPQVPQLGTPMGYRRERERITTEPSVLETTSSLWRGRITTGPSGLDKQLIVEREDNHHRTIRSGKQ
jgi:hypothetical protein